MFGTIDENNQILLIELQIKNSYISLFSFQNPRIRQLYITSQMKKRRAQKESKTINESLDYDINNIHINQSLNHQSQNMSKFDQRNQMNKKSSPQQFGTRQKTCGESLKEKLQYYWIQMVNYLQFDRILTHQQIELLKNEQYVIKTKYPQNYYATYKQRQRSFGITIEEITKMKKQQEEIKNKQFWSQLKRFICCQGGNELQEDDQILTAATQKQYFYVKKVKKYPPNNIQTTEQSLIEKPFKNLVRQDTTNENQFDNKNSVQKQQNFIFGFQQLQSENDKHKKSIQQQQKQTLKSPNKHQTINVQKQFNKDLTNQRYENSSKSAKKNSGIQQYKFSSQQDNINQIKDKNEKSAQSSSQNKQIDINNIRTVKRNHSDLQQLSFNQKDNGAKNNNKQNTNKQIANNSSNQQNSSTNQNFILKDTQKVFVHNRENSHPINQKDNQIQFSSLNKKENSQKNGIFSQNKNNSNPFERKQNQSAISSNYSKTQTRDHSQAAFENSPQHSTLGNSSPSQSFNKLVAMNTNLVNNEKHGKFDLDQINEKNDSNIFDKSEGFQLQQDKLKSSDDYQLKKNNKRNKSLLPKQESFLNIEVVQNLDQLEPQNIEENQIDLDQFKKKNSFSMQQLSKKRNKRAIKNHQFDSEIYEGKQIELDESKNSQTIELDDNKSTILSDNNLALQLAKKKKLRNKKLFNLKQTDQNLDQIFIFPQEQQENNERQSSMSQAHTIDVASDLNSHRTSGPNIKKKKKTKKLQQLNNESQIIVIQGDQLIQQQSSNQDQTLQKNSTSNYQNGQSQFGPVKAEKKRKKKARLREEIQKQEEQFEIVDFGEIN